MNRLKFRAVIRENIKSGLAKGANLYRIGTWGETKTEAVSNLEKCVKAICLEDKARSKMLAACDHWLVQNAETYTPTQAGICGVALHDAQNAAANDGDLQIHTLVNKDARNEAAKESIIKWWPTDAIAGHSVERAEFHTPRGMVIVSLGMPTHIGLDDTTCTELRIFLCGTWHIGEYYGSHSLAYDGKENAERLALHFAEQAHQDDWAGMRYE